jgi:hypothetical protein
MPLRQVGITLSAQGHQRSEPLLHYFDGHAWGLSVHPYGSEHEDGFFVDASQSQHTSHSQLPGSRSGIEPGAKTIRRMYGSCSCINIAGLMFASA